MSKTFFQKLAEVKGGKKTPKIDIKDKTETVKKKADKTIK
tara:strand:- start:416 stop:535 length:120 start_codon:yes stop_codon:yes gene_type:complete